MKVTIIDYGLSNLLSVQHAFAHFGAETLLTSKPEDVLAADALVLPGVGAFQDGMAGLEKLGLVEPIRQKAAAGTPLLGICLGMQMLFDESEEFGLHKGLEPAVPRRQPRRFWRHGVGGGAARRGVLLYPQLRGQAHRRNGLPGLHGLRRPPNLCRRHPRQRPGLPVPPGKIGGSRVEDYRGVYEVGR